MHQESKTKSFKSGSETKADKPQKKPNLKLIFRLILSFGLLLFIYRSIDLTALLNTLSKISLSGALALILLYTFGQILSAIKWSLFVRNIGVKRSFSEILKAYFFGMFINTFGLGTVGGDVARSLALKPEKGKRAAAIATAVADRVHGLGTLLSIGAFAVILVRPPILGNLAIPFSILAIVSISLAWLFGPKLLTRIFPASHRFGASAISIANAFPKERDTFLRASLISVSFHFVQIFMNLLIAKELAVDVPLGYLFAVVPLINIASAMPISVNGLGIRETGYIFLLAPLGVSNEVAVAFGAIWILVVTLVSSLGGALVASSLKLDVHKDMKSDIGEDKKPDVHSNLEQDSFVRKKVNSYSFKS